ncbi:thiamine diphosphokinase [Gracilibacillus sp. YIM 98692]|uniref:thiamine diphosphokinase n=1 Tax=Gracilibacillus sp. YIM 98692 TaxID=2663532 RepID=UPI0013D3921C|nr:thiamine diphosphokinase [Gracilibacillus sp. YIM 98692]
MTRVGIVAGGPNSAIADLTQYRQDIDIWIGADLGAWYILEKELILNTAVGDFDSVNNDQLILIQNNAISFKQYPIEKDATDLELAIEIAFHFQPSAIHLFGVTAGRLDHELANIQMLYQIMNKGVEATIVDSINELSLFRPGSHKIYVKNQKVNISFLPFSNVVQNLTLGGFYYPLYRENLEWGTTLCLSNYLIEEEGTFSFDSGILIMIKSRES